MTDDITGARGLSSMPAGDVPVTAQIPAEPGWADLAKAVGIIWALEIGLSCITLAVLFVVSGFNPGSMDMRVEYMLPALFLSWAGALVVIWYFARRKCHQSVRQTLAIHRVSWRTLAYCALMGGICAFGAGILMVFFSTGKGMIVDLIYEPPAEEGGAPRLSIAFLVVALTVPLLEEAYYRGFLYGILRRLVGVPLAATVIIGWFGLVHAPQLFGDWVGIVVVTVMGALFTLLRQWHDSLWPPVATHLTYNACLVLFSMIGLSITQ